MIITINNAQFKFINYCVYVSISHTLYEEIMKEGSLSAVKDERYGTIFARTTMRPSDIIKFKGANVVFTVEKIPGSDRYILSPVVYKHKYEGIIRNEPRLDNKYYEALKAIREYERRNSMFGIKNVIHHDPATIVYWCDGTKTVVKCGENDIYDPEKGLAMAISKKVFGNEGNYYNVFKKWL